MDDSPPHRSAADDRGAAGALTRDRVVHAAIGLVDAEGLTALSMRRLGADLGVEAMALYRHIEGREDLLEAVVDHLVSGLEDTVPAERAPRGDWRSYLEALASAVRELAHRHPRLFPLVATRHPAAPWLRPPLRSLELVESFLAALSGHGFGDAEAVAAYRAFTSFLIGQLLLDVAERDASVAPEGVRVDAAARAGGQQPEVLAQYPTVRRLSERLSEDRSDEEFHAALSSLLDRLEHQLAP